MLMLFKVDEIVPYDASSLESARLIMVQNTRLKEQMHRKVAS